MLVLRSFPRIHVCLLDLAGATGRKNGGAGFTLDGLSTIIKVGKVPLTTVTVVGNDEELSEAIKGLLERLRQSVDEKLTFSLEIIPPPALHVGLGSKTAVLLGILEGLTQTFGLQLSPSRLQALSGRGGTSGIGINTFFSGGFVVDGGHPQDGSRDFLPSSARGNGFPIPPVMMRADIPSHWRFHLFVPPKGLKWFGRDETAFFKANTPLPASEVFESIALVYHSIVPAVMQGDLKLLNAGIRGVSNVAFKRREIHAQSREVKDLIATLSAYPGSAVGMSSMGPLIYAITSSVDCDFEAHVKHLMEHADCGYLGTFAGRNRGFEVEHD
jgi:beta-ribofuranosylaminobenzene 5'-phosphate synthase